MSSDLIAPEAMLSASFEMSDEAPMDYLDTPAFLWRQLHRPGLSMDQIVSRLNHAYPSVDPTRLDIDSLSDLEHLGVASKILEQLNELVEEAYPEEMVIIAWLSVLIDSDEGSAASRHVRRLIHKAQKRLDIGGELKAQIGELMDIALLVQKRKDYELVLTGQSLHILMVR